MTLDDIVLPDDLEWTDELTWSPIMQSVEYGATGKPLIQESEMQSGRSITLQGAEDMAWITRATLNALILKRNTKGLTMTLTINETPYNVIFNHSNGAVDVSPIRKGDFFGDEAWYKINSLKFIEVEE